MIQHCLQNNVSSKHLVEALLPEPEDDFVSRPKHSSFYSMALDVFLEYSGAKTLILTGLAGNICLLFTANDAYMRGMTLLTPSNYCASDEVEDNNFALSQREKMLKVDIRPSTELNLDEISKKAQ